MSVTQVTMIRWYQGLRAPLLILNLNLLNPELIEVPLTAL